MTKCRNSNQHVGRRRIKTTVPRIALYLAVAFVALITPLTASSLRIQVAEPAPDFALKSFAGENLRLSEYRGEVVMINFWATWCGRCRDQLPKLDALFAERRDDRFQLLSVSIDADEFRARETASDLQISFPILFDDQKVVSRLYDLRTMPLTVLVDHSGAIRYIHEGYRGGDEKTYGTELEILLAE